MSNWFLKSRILAALCLLIYASTGAMSVARAGESSAFRDFKVGQPIEIEANQSDSGRPESCILIRLRQKVVTSRPEVGSSRGILFALDGLLRDAKARMAYQ